MLGNISRHVNAAIQADAHSIISFCRLHLSLPEDDYQAWKVLLYWVAKRCLPKEATDSELLLVHSWALGEKYDIADFQDEVMLALLIRCAGKSMGIDAIRNAFVETETDSQLSYLMAEELLYRLGQADGKVGAMTEDEIDGIVEAFVESLAGFAATVLKVRRRCANYGEGWYRRFVRRKGDQYGRWKSFMVGDALMVRGRAVDHEALYHQPEDDKDEDQ